MMECDFSLKVNAYKDRNLVILQGVDNGIIVQRVNFELAFADFIKVLATMILLSINDSVPNFFNVKNGFTYHKNRFNQNDSIELNMIVYGKNVKVLLCDSGANLNGSDILGIKKLGIAVNKSPDFNYINN